MDEDQGVSTPPQESFGSALLNRTELAWNRKRNRAPG
jgi:hypothetical protein